MEFTRDIYETIRFRNSRKFNHRILQYAADALSGTVVASGNGIGTRSTQLSIPNSLIISNIAAHNIVRWIIGVSS